MYRKLALLAFIIVIFSACGPSDKRQEQNGDALIVCTTGMIGDMIQNLAGEELQVISLMGPGVDPHLYKATQNDLKLLKDADLVFYNGLHLEGKMASIFEKFSRTKKVYAISNFADSTQFLSDPAYKNVKDPHIWFDVDLWRSCLDGVTEILCNQYPDKCEDIKNNSTMYSEKLRSLHEEVKSEIARIPKSRRVLITAHDAFNYFGRAYDIEVRGLQGISTLSEFGLKDRVEMVNFIIEKKIPTVFIESSVSPKNIEAITEGCRSKGHKLEMGEALYSDAMGEAGTKEGSYTGMVRANVKHIVTGLLKDLE